MKGTHVSLCFMGDCFFVCLVVVTVMLFFANVQYSKDDIMDSYYTSTALKIASPERASGMKAVKNKFIYD